MKVYKVVLITISMFFCSASLASAQNSSLSGGQKCAKSQIGQTIDSGGFTFLCKKSGKKQFWRWQSNIDLCDKSVTSTLTGCSTTQINEWIIGFEVRSLEKAKIFNANALEHSETSCYSLFGDQNFDIGRLNNYLTNLGWKISPTSEVKATRGCGADLNLQAPYLPSLQVSWADFAIAYNEYSAAYAKGMEAIKNNRFAVIKKSGNCLWDPTDLESQLLINGKTYNGLGGSLLLCKNGVIVDQGKKPFTATYLTCAAFNSKSDNGCWVKDSWGYLTWLFNLPMKTPEGQPVSTGSYYTNNGYCQVALYKNFAWTDSCR